MTWQSIDTAPRDGTEVQIWSGEWIPKARYGGSGWYVEYYNDDWRTYEKAPVYHATHWQPLPEPPNTTTGSQET